MPIKDWDGWTISGQNVTKLIFEEYLLRYEARGVSGATESLAAWRELMAATNKDLEAQCDFSYKHAGYIKQADGSWKVPEHSVHNIETGKWGAR